MGTPPDYILVILLDKQGRICSRDSFPLDLCLLATLRAHGIVMPIAMSQIEDLIINKEDEIKIKYFNHALDLGFAFTAWKVQGLIFNLIIILLDQFPGRKNWTFENLYLVFSRVTTNDGIRYLPLTQQCNSN